MQIHELNNFTGTLGSGSYLAIDDGNDTGKISKTQLFAATEARIDNIIAGEAPSAEEIVDARLGDDGVVYPSLGDAIRDQFSDVKSDLSNVKKSIDYIYLVNDPAKVQYVNQYSAATVNSFVYNNINITPTASNQNILIKKTGRVLLKDHKYLCAIKINSVSAWEPDARNITMVFQNDGNVSNWNALKVTYGQLYNQAILTPTINTDIGFYIYFDAGFTIDFSIGIYDITDYENDVIQQIDFTNLPTTYSYTSTDHADASDYANEIKLPKRVACFGDSLTMGSGGNGVTYPSVLASLLGGEWSVTNQGVGGESSLEVMVRQGSAEALVKPFTIPASGSVEIAFEDIVVGRNIGVTVTASDSRINPVKIGGVEGVIDHANNAYTFTRSESGSSITLNRPTLVETHCETYRNDLQVIWVGTNGGWNESGSYTPDSLISQIDRMVDFLGNPNRPFLVIGLHHLFNWMTGVTLESLEKAMSMRYGRRFINQRKYIVTPIYNSNDEIISCYGLSDRNITPTANDITAIANGVVPPSLMADDVHYNGDAYHIVANLVYKRGKELKYWD